MFLLYRCVTLVLPGNPPLSPETKQECVYTNVQHLASLECFTDRSPWSTSHCILQLQQLMDINLSQHKQTPLVGGWLPVREHSDRAGYKSTCRHLPSGVVCPLSCDPQTASICLRNNSTILIIQAFLH